VANQMLVLASGVKDACDKIDKGLEGMTVDYDIVAVAESPIMDFFPYFSEGAEVGEKGKVLAEIRAKTELKAKADREAAAAILEEDEEDYDDEDLEELPDDEAEGDDIADEE